MSSRPTAGEAPPCWRPLLKGEAATAAAAAVADLASDLWHEAEAVPTGPDGTIRLVEHPSLDGLGGVSLFLTYLDLALRACRNGPLMSMAAAARTTGRDSVWGERGRAALDRAVARAGITPFPPALFDGFVGLAWLIEHLQNLDSAEEPEVRIEHGAGREDTEISGEAADAGGPIAGILRQYLGQTPWVRDFDLVSGLAGCGVYALERLPRQAGEDCLMQVVARLAETAQRGQRGVTWLTPARLLPLHQRSTYPDGNYNLGVAHGVPGAIGVLARTWEVGVERPLVFELLVGAVAWLTKQKLPAGSSSVYPYNVAPGVAPTVPGVAWCYGDLGIAVCLLAAARRVGVAAWEHEAMALARETAARRPPQPSRQDPCLCHGAAGNGHLFNRLYQATGERSFAAAARWWLGRALALRQPGTGLAGFSYWTANGADGPAMHPEPGFLNGAAGTGLALLGAISPVPPEWDRLLLASLPPG